MRFSGFLIGALVAASASSQAQVYFTQEERSQVLEYWSSQDRYKIAPLSDAILKGTWRVRLTPEGSQWLWNYSRLIQPEKVSPSQDVKPLTPQQKVWETWVSRKVAWDNWKAAKDAFEKNRAEGAPAPDPAGPEPQRPGSKPTDLRLSNPPAFANIVQPALHQVQYDDGTELTYQDNVGVRPRFAYYRFADGIQSFGQKVKEMGSSELSSLAREAGISDSDLKVLNSVSLLEGGFDSINTYDTGFVSVGMIQFAAMQGGSGSLGRVLLRMKQRAPGEFVQNFRRYGLEVTPGGELAALCPTSGAEFIGPQAAQKIIMDKRLASVFQRAGRLSREFKVSQLMTAKELYHPASDTIRVRAGSRTWNVRVADVFRSEAGIATLMDRKVNTGKLGSLDAVASTLANRAMLDKPEDLALLEYDMIQAMKYRKDYLSDPSLTKPRDINIDGLRAQRAGVTRGTTASRSGTRSGRTASGAKAKTPVKKSSK